MKQRNLSIGQQVLLIVIWLGAMLLSALILIASLGTVTISILIGVTIPYIVATVLSIPITRNPRGPEQRW
jgi:hypothetical protein